MVTATDAAGNAAVEKRLTIRMDRTLPLVPTLIAPAIVNGTSPLGLTLAATDATSGVATVEWFACGGAACAPLATEPFLVSTTGPDYAASWTPAAGDGPYRLRARVTDDAGNVRTSNVRNVTVDSVAPTVTITAPASGAAVGGTAVNFAATVDDVGSGVANVVFEYRPAGQPSATWTVLLDPPGAASEGVRSVRNLPQGDFEVRAVATDRAGNSSVSPPVPFTIANWRATSVALSNHADGGVRGRVDVGDRVTLGFSADVAPASACTGLVDGTDRPIAVRLADGGPNGDQLVLGSPPCDLGSISLGSAGYAIGGDVVFSATVHWSASAPAQVTVVLDALDLLADAARLATAAAGARAAYTPATTLRSAVGVPIDAGTVVRTTTTIQF